MHPLHQPPKIFLLHHTSLTHQNTYPMPILLPLTHLHQLLIPQALTIHTTLIPHSPQTPQLHHLPSLLPYPPNPLLPYLPQPTIQQLTPQPQLSPTLPQNLPTYTNLFSQRLI
ncbi:glutamate synthase central domain-containing protein, partial [Staphylococcus epidermidis]|uniref:glutamate synthase central domain-containing protein n=1 Tax=Staphylococcus epidermidis TaxID=1282 RepID=UPI0021B39752